MSTIVFDMDGVLADWASGFTSLAAQLYPNAGIEIVSHNKIAHWDRVSNLTEEQFTETWERARESRVFWRGLPRLVSYDTFEAIAVLTRRGHIVYFATSRTGQDAYNQTSLWLKYFGILHASIVVTHRKGEFCKVVDANYYIDDKSENCDCVAWITDGRTKPFVLTRPYNSGELAPHSSKVGRVSSVEEFLDIVEGAQHVETR